MEKIKNITPRFRGYDDFPKDENGKIILPRNKDDVIIIDRKNTVDYGKGLIGLCDGSLISTDDWIQLRRCFVLREDNGAEKFYWCIGGSDSGTVLGINPYNNIEKLYSFKKTGIADDIDDEQDYLFEYGHINEELIAKGFAKKSNMLVVKDNTVFFNERTGFMQANVDFFVQHPDKTFSILEIKTTNPENYKAINNYKQGVVPDYYYSQAVLHYPLVIADVFPIKGTYFAVGYSNSLKDIIICHFDRDKKQEDKLLEVEREFEAHLIYNEKPKAPIINSKALIDSIKAQFPVAKKDKVCKLTPHAENAVIEMQMIQAEIAKLKASITALEETANLYRAEIIEEMEDAEVSESISIDGTDYAVNYKNTTRTTIDKNILSIKYPEIYDETKSESTSRTLRIVKVKKKKGENK